MTANEVFPQVADIIVKTTQKFRSRYGGDFYELLSEAQFAWLHRYNLKIRNCGELNCELDTFTSQSVWYSLLEYRRTRGKASQKEQTIKDKISKNEAAVKEYYTDCLLQHLGSDAQKIVDFIINNQDLVRQRMKKVSRNTQSYRMRAVSHLLTEFGWTTKQIAQAFSEITNVL